ncbi:hypothetical protein JCM5296_007254 [Sporobolomyces johnsonii]
MLKAKAKAAATAAAAKRKAAAAAAAAAEAAAQQAQAATSGVGVSTTRSGRGIRPNVTQYWADSASNILAPGGSIQRIGYDQAGFEEAFRVVVMGLEPTPVADGEAGPSRVGMIDAQGGAKEEQGEAKEEGKDEQEPFKINKDDLALIVNNLDVPPAVASRTLRAHKGDMAATLRELTGPRPEALASA